MADDEGGDAVRLGDAQEVDGALAHLRDTARRALHVRLEDGLDGIDDEQLRLDVLDMRLDHLEVRFADDEQIVGESLQAVGAHADLPRALLARHIEDLLALPRDVGADAQRQARLADARVTDNQDHRARDDAAAQDAVELARARQEARHVLELALSNRLRLLGIGEPESQAASSRRRLRRDGLLNKRVPGATARTAPHPLRGVVAAFLADVDGFLLLWHDTASNLLVYLTQFSAAAGA